MADIIVDTYKLNQYAQRVSDVNRRINRLDRRLDDLYTRVGLQGLWNLMQMDALTCYSWRLLRCQTYLQQTAIDFETVERTINYDMFKSSQKGINWVVPNAPFPIIKPLSHITYEPLFPEILTDKVNDYIDIINGGGDLREKAQGAIKWLSSIRKDISGYKEYIEWLTEEDIKLPSPIKNGFDFIKALDTGNNLIFGMLDYGTGLANGDVDTMVDGANGLFSALKSAISETIKTNNAKIDFGAGLLLDYGKNMISNWLDSIKTETKVSEVYWNTFANSALEVFSDTVCSTPTLVIAYKPAEMISSVVGFDLQAAYEKVSDKKGFAAVTDSVSQLGDMIIENSTWENWKSGMKIMGDSIASWFN